MHRNPTPAEDRRVHVVDDDPAVLVSVGTLIERAGFSVTMHRDVTEFLDRLSVGDLSCVVLDMRMPGVQGMSLLQELHSRHPDLPVVMISGEADIPTALEAMRCGALDFLEKPVQPDQLIDRIEKAFEFALSQRDKRARASDIRDRVRGLTPREREVMELLREGKSVKAIAYDFGVSHKTVQVHRARILDRMRVESLVGLTNLMHELEESERDPLPGNFEDSDKA